MPSTTSVGVSREMTAATATAMAAAMGAAMADDMKSKQMSEAEAIIAAAQRSLHHTGDADDSLESKFTDDELLKTRTIIMKGDDPESKRAEIREYFHRTFSLFERLHDVLANDSILYQQPDKLRHPLIFYLCHTAVLYINKLRLAKLLPRINEKIESSCAVGVDEMSWDDLNEAHYTWPTPEQARDYRNKVRVAVDGLIQTLPITLPISWESPWWIILLGIEHERIHLETSSVLIRQLPIAMVKPSSLWKLCPSRRTDITSVPINELKPIPGGVVQMGRPQDHALWGWDVDYGTHTATVAPFNASRYLVSNAEYNSFIVDGGYENKANWTTDGWEWVVWKKARHPLFWVPIYAPSSTSHAADADATPPTPPVITGYRYRAYAEEIDMPWDWPVDINQMEAKAFCNWKSSKTGKNIRLPTEEEWNQLREVVWPETADKCEDQATWRVAPGNINLEHWSSSCPIDMFEFNSTGLYDIIGNVWQHTETPTMPFNGFRTHPIYDDFSVPTFDTRHNMIMGGSWISTGNEATRHARYAFRRHFYQHAGFRYIESTEEVVVKERIPPPEPEVARWADAHYGQSYLGVANYSVALVSHVTSTIDAYERRSTGRTTSRNVAAAVAASIAPPTSVTETKGETKKADGITGVGHEGRRRAVDIGCAAGRASLELGRHYDSVLGLDFSTRFFRVATQLQQEGVFRYDLPLSGELTSYHSISLEEMGLSEASKRVEFSQADACNLDPKYRDFDIVMASNLLSHLYAPAKFLDHIRSRLRPGAFLVIAETWDWRTETTPRDSWLGGYKEAGETVSNLDGLERKLGTDFTMIAPPHELQWLVRRSERSFDHHISQVTIWRLRA